MSQETDYKGSLILYELSFDGIELSHNVHRVRPILDETQKLYDLEMTRLFKIANVQQEIKQIEVFDDFAVVIDLDEAMHVAIRPTSVGSDAVYSVPPVKGITTNFLWKYRTPIVARYISRTPIPNQWRVDMIVRNGTNLLPEQYNLEVQPILGTADFSQLPIPNANTTI